MSTAQKPAPWTRNSADPPRHRVRRYRLELFARARTSCREQRTNEPRDASRDLHSTPSPCRHTKCTNRRARRFLRSRSLLRPNRFRPERYTANCCRCYLRRCSNLRCSAVLHSKVHRARRMEHMSIAPSCSRLRRSCRRRGTSPPRSTAGRSLRSCWSPRRHRHRLHRQRRSCHCPRPRRP